ncbi:hypothetical protein E0G79_26060 [Salmonella enterica]|nr:hypothetical protein [Salmonella enterica]EBA9765541.1 hypothetical protein [Salmonella enterica]EEB5699294.1 hypothetical protein [Salmonella enterica]EGX5144522.1 hypothetical protein [Salmonella enterica]ELF4900205.1 hypothetical protein [Salmonella enterica]
MLTSIMIFLIGLAGAVMVSAGVWMMSPPGGIITGGLFCLWLSCMSARSIAQRRKPGEKE